MVIWPLHMEAFKALFHQASATGSRSTVLQPLIWFIGMLTIALGTGGYYQTPFWILVIMAGAWIAAVILFFTFYVYFGRNDPDRLQSERFAALKMAIEKNWIGDNTRGLVEIDETRDMRAITTPPATKQLEGSDQ